MNKGNVYWLHGRTFIAGKEGRKFVTGLVIEADGLYTKKVPLTETLKPVMFHGQPYPARKLRGHLRKMKPATKGAKVLRRELLA
jgi:hypothetical protein